MIEDTKHAAAAFLGDLPEMRELVHSASPDKARIRRLSSILRRLLVEDDLSKIATPRIGKLHLVAPDNSRAVQERNREIVLYLTGSPLVRPRDFLMDLERNSDGSGGVLGVEPWSSTFLSLKSVRIGGFLSQSIVCFRGKWACRRDIIKYAANIGSGVHSSLPKTEIERMLHRVRYALENNRREDGLDSFSFNMGTIGNPLNAAPSKPITFKHDQSTVDIILIEVLAATYYFLQSEEIIKLEQKITDELA